MAAKFFRYPFAVSGDRLTIPDPAAMDGSVSYQQGFPPDYEKNLITDPQAKPIPRDQFNELLFETTLAIQQYQTEGFPDFITSTDNGGSPYPYDIYAIVRYNPGSGMKLYQSKITNNTDTPPSANWSEFGLVAGGQPFASLTFSPTQTQVVPPTGSPQKVLFGTALDNPNGLISGNGFQVPAGLWRVTHRIPPVTATSGGILPINYDVWVYKNGATQIKVFATTFTYRFNTNDLIEVYLLATNYDGSGDQQTLTFGDGVNSNLYCQFEIEFVGP